MYLLIYKSNFACTALFWMFFCPRLSHRICFSIMSQHKLWGNKLSTKHTTTKWGTKNIHQTIYSHTPRNLYSLTIGISGSSILITGSLYIFLREKKCTHWVLYLENLNPFSPVHLFYLGLFVVVTLLCSYEWPDSIWQSRQCSEHSRFRGSNILQCYLFWWRWE